MGPQQKHSGRQSDRNTDHAPTPDRTSLGWSPFHTAARDYLAAGYMPIPLPLGKKGPPPNGTPNDIVINEAQVDAWIAGKYTKRDGTPYTNSQDKNIGCVVPDGYVVIDIDGAAARESLKELENQHGALPKTWMSFRGNPDRYHMWFATPRGLTWPGRLAAGIDIIYRHYRYMVLPPSIHPDGGQYRWANLRREKLSASPGYFPGLDELSDLPESWEALAGADGYVQRDRADVDARLWMSEHGNGPICPEMSRVVKLNQRLLRKHADLGGMHDAMVNGVWSILAEMAQGHSGGHNALRRFKKTFMAQADGSGRRQDDAADLEWGRACVGAVEKTALEFVRVGDPCEVEEAERDADPDRFFDPKYGLKARELRLAVERTGRLAVGPGKSIYRHVEGVWTPDGESEIYRRSVTLLRDRYRPDHAANVRSVVANREPLISDDTTDVQYLNLPNGLLAWKEGKLYPHNPHVISTVRIPIPWDEDAECPEIDQFFAEVFPADAIELAYEILGYMLFNDNPLHKAILLHGSGRNGKGTFIRLARMLVGHNNISAVTPQDLDSSAFSSAQLHGKLANLVGDVDPRIFKSTERFKQLTGGDYVMAQHKHRDPFNFLCRALMVAAFNALPRTADTTEGFFSRWVVVPFTAFFPAGKADTTLIARLTHPKELQGLLRGAVSGLQQVMRRGQFSIPPSVAAATARFKTEADPIRGFIAERLEFTRADKVFVPRSDVYVNYGMWASSNGYHEMGASRFYAELQAAVIDTTPYRFRAVTLHGTAGYKGIALQD